MSNKAKIKSCPFCGSKPEGVRWAEPGFTLTSVRCSQHNCIAAFKSVELDVWNRRAETTTTAAQPLDLGKLAEIANRVQARGLFNASCDILDWIQEVHTAQARASQPEGATGTTGASIDTLEFQSLAGTWCGAAQSCDQWTRTIGAKQAWADLITYIDAIIIDLRAQLAAKCEEANAWSERWLKEKQLAAKGQEAK